MRNIYVTVIRRRNGDMEHVRTFDDIKAAKEDAKYLAQLDQCRGCEVIVQMLENINQSLQTDQEKHDVYLNSPEYKKYDKEMKGSAEALKDAPDSFTISTRSMGDMTDTKSNERHEEDADIVYAGCSNPDDEK